MVAQGEKRAIALSTAPLWKKARIDCAKSGDSFLRPSKNNRGRTVLGEHAVFAFELNLQDHEPFVIAVGFGQTGNAAALQARAALHQDFDTVAKAYAEEWSKWQNSLLGLGEEGQGRCDLYRTSAAVLRTHQGKQVPGSVVASLSIPWGPTKRDPDAAAYHLVWTRDLVEIAGAFCAMGDCEPVRNVLRYLAATQHADGHWAQNMRIDGTPHWRGVQLDETALPILLVELASRRKVLHDDDVERYWSMVEHAAGYLVKNGPITEEDRWEKNSGFVSSTLAAIIAGLFVAAEISRRLGKRETTERWKSLAHEWDQSIEKWIYVAGTDLARRHHIDGYYVWLRPAGCEDLPLEKCKVHLAHKLKGDPSAVASNVVSPDFLALVRFGLRKPNDPRILDSLKIIDASLRAETPNGPAWRRYTGDGYGETADGSPFRKRGIGRAWPLLTGERAHYELAAGRPDVANELKRALEKFAGEAGLLPEQVWDAEDIPSKNLFRGYPTGSARPLTWAHAEYIKLLRSLRDNRVFDCPPCVVERTSETHTARSSAQARHTVTMNSRRR
jgi:glucoamylase